MVSSLPTKPFAAQESPRDHMPKSAKVLPRVPAGSIGTSSGDGSRPDIAKVVCFPVFHGTKTKVTPESN